MEELRSLLKGKAKQFSCHNSGEGEGGFKEKGRTAPTGAQELSPST